MLTVVISGPPDELAVMYHRLNDRQPILSRLEAAIRQQGVAMGQAQDRIAAQFTALSDDLTRIKDAITNIGSGNAGQVDAAVQSELNKVADQLEGVVTQVDQAADSLSGSDDDTLTGTPLPDTGPASTPDV